MKIHHVLQGSQEWLELRGHYFTASEAPTMMGVSPYMTRTQLLHQKHTGIALEIDPYTQYRFDKGHATEAAYRHIAERFLGGDLYPITGSCQVGGLNLLASFDGLTVNCLSGYEHKLFNTDLAKMLQNDGEPGPAWYWQLEHQLLVSGAEQILFVTSDGTDTNHEYCFYRSKPERRTALIAGWQQFATDLANYVPEPAAQPAVIGKALDTLPALLIQVTGTVTASNLVEFKTHAMEVFGGINRVLETDQDFADAERTVKWCADVEDRLKAAKEHALSQTASIDALFKTIDDIGAEARTIRLELDKLVKVRKEQIRNEMVTSGIAALSAHISQLNEAIGRPLMPAIAADFAGAIKNKRTLDSLRDAISTELAKAKIVASEVSGRIHTNLRALSEHADLLFLFPDTRELVLKSADDLGAIIMVRIAHHKESEAKRLKDIEAAVPSVQPVIESTLNNEMTIGQDITFPKIEVPVAYKTFQLTAIGVKKLATYLYNSNSTNYENSEECYCHLMLLIEDVCKFD